MDNFDTKGSLVARIEEDLTKYYGIVSTKVHVKYVIDNWFIPTTKQAKFLEYLTPGLSIGENGKSKIRKYY
jgi:hypothetical protein